MTNKFNKIRYLLACATVAGSALVPLGGSAQAASRPVAIVEDSPKTEGLNDWLQRLDDLQLTLARCVKQGIRQQRLATKNLAERLARVRPALLLKQRRELFLQAQQRLHEQARHRIREATNRLDALAGRLRPLGPDQVLARGYSITMDAATGAVFRQASALKPGQLLNTRLKAGEVKSRVENAG